MRILLTGACGVTPRAIARSLRLSDRFHDARLVGTDRGGNWYGFHEGLLDRIYRVPGVRDPGYVEALTDVCETEAVDAAVISPEAEVAFWSARRFPVPALVPPAALVATAVSKKRLHDALAGTDLVPEHWTVSRDALLARQGLALDDGPVWLRDFSDGSSSGLGAILVGDAERASAWARLNPEIDEYLVARFLPGRNLACCALFVDGELRRIGCYERLEYFGARLVISGVTGNISRGRLVDDTAARAAGERAVRAVGEFVGEPPHGLFTIDLREADDGSPKVTEINVRHTACTSSLAAGGANLAEAQVLATLGRQDEIGPCVTPPDGPTEILRDIDGPPLLADPAPPAVGDFVDPPSPRA